MSKIIDALQHRLQAGFHGFVNDSEGALLQLPTFTALSKASLGLQSRFDMGAPQTPALQLRIQALARLRMAATLNAQQWRLIAWGLSEECGTAGCPLDDSDLYPLIQRYFDQALHNGQLSRRTWFGLAYSYFAYPRDNPAENPQWSHLKQQVRQGFEQLQRKERRPRLWSQVMAKNLDLFGASPGKALSQALLRGDESALSELRAHIPIAASSWLWRYIIEAQLAQLPTLPEQDFLAQIDRLLWLKQDYPRYADTILAATLSRYALSSRYDEPHPELKSLALDRWGSPQIRSSNNRWKIHVGDDVCKMVLRWFAKEDLEHFFKLMQGESGVDQARLDYWLRFVDQMAYTRIVLGTHAVTDRSTDFVEFREKNKGRFSRLDGGTADDNAFVMQIGDYYFVEFSRTGNACYYYKKDSLHFEPSSPHLSLNVDLKHPKRSSNDGVASNKFSHSGTWQSKADTLLRQLGISINSEPTRPRSTYAPKILEAQGGDSDKDRPDPKDALHTLFEKYNIHLDVTDHRAEGGALWLKCKARRTLIENDLRRIGFSYAENRGYWMK